MDISEGIDGVGEEVAQRPERPPANGPHTGQQIAALHIGTQFEPAARQWGFDIQCGLPASADIDGHGVGVIGDRAGKAALVIAGRHGDGQARWYAELVGHCCGQGTGHGTRFGEIGKQRLA